MMNFRCPPSSALSCMTAWAVVADPEKKSRQIADLSPAAAMNVLIRSTDLG